MVDHTRAVAAVLGMLAALGIGTTDLFGRRVVAASTALTAGATLQLFATVSVLSFAVVSGSAFQPASFVWGGVSGLGLGAGIWLYYSGLVHSVSTGGRADGCRAERAATVRLHRSSG